MMNREILFRGKRIDNGEWVEGYYIKLSNKSYISQNLKNEQGIEIMRWVEVIHETVGRYTGLTDKSGKKIFEGDIVKCCYYPEQIFFMAVVEFGNPNAAYNWGWQLKYIAGDTANLDILLWVDMEDTGVYCKVIGNIHDNPELLKG